MRTLRHGFRFSRVSMGGFTLVEIMVVVVIIGLLVALAIPAFRHLQRSSKNSRIENDFRIYAQAFEIYNTQNGGWPNEAAPGVIPSLPESMAGNFREAGWQAVTSIGGHWKWEKDSAGVTAGISIVGFTADDDQLLDIDTKMDDGKLSTGNLQKTSATSLTLVLSP